MTYKHVKTLTLSLLVATSGLLSVNAHSFSLGDLKAIGDALSGGQNRHYEEQMRIKKEEDERYRQAEQERARKWQESEQQKVKLRAEEDQQRREEQRREEEALMALLHPSPDWNPIDGGVYDQRIQLRSTVGKSINWSANRAAATCQGSPAGWSSRHDILGMKLGDVCGFSAQQHAAFVEAVKLEASRSTQKLHEVIRRQGDKRSGNIGEERVRQGFFGQNARFNAVGDGDKEAWVTVFWGTFYSEPGGAVAIEIVRDFCAASPENTLDPGSSFLHTLIAKYGKPTAAISKNTRDQKELDARMEAASQLMALQERYRAGTPAEIARNKQKLKELEGLTKATADHPAAKDNYIAEIQWVYDDHRVVIRRSEEGCEGLPRFSLTLDGRGGKSAGLASRQQASEKLSRQMAEKSAQARQKEAALPKL